MNISGNLFGKDPNRSVFIKLQFLFIARKNMWPGYATLHLVILSSKGKCKYVDCGKAHAHLRVLMTKIKIAFDKSN